MLRWVMIIACSFWLQTLMGQRMHFDIFSREEGLSSSSIYDLLEDSNGHLWIATEGGGLCRFDGKQFEVWDRRKGISQTSVRCLYEDSNLTLWAGLPGDGLLSIQGDSAVAMAMPDGVSEVHVRSIIEGPKGAFYVSTLGQGLLERTGGKLSPVDTPDGFDKNIRTSLRASDGSVWFGTDNGIWKFHQGTWEHCLEGIPSPKILCSFRQGESLFFGTEQGALWFQNNALKDPFLFEVDGARVRSISSDEFGNIWFATRDGAIRKKISSSGIVERARYNESSGLSTNRIRKIYKDRNGVMWFGTYFGGICALEDEQFAQFDSGLGFPEENVTSTLVTQGGNLWFGTFAGDLFELRHENLYQRYKHKKREDLEITALAEKADGTILVGTDGSGLLSWNGRKLKEVYPEDETGRILAIAIRGEHMLVAGSELTIDYGFFWEDVTKLSPLRQVNAAMFASDDALWIGTPRGLFRSDWIPEEGIYSRFTRIDGTSIMNITSLTETADGQIWFGGEGSGVLRVEGSGYQSYRDAEALDSYIVNFVKEDIEKNLWVGTPNGLHQFMMDPGGTEILRVKHFDADEGFVGVETNPNAVSVDRDGHIWVGTTQGISRVDLRARRGEALPPVPRLTEVFSGDQSLSVSAIGSGSALEELIELSPYENEFSFSWEAISLTRPGDLRYRVMLEGHDKNWRQMTSATNMRYSNLSPGDYAFKVEASLDNLQWSEPSQLARFCLKPPVYETWWFRLIAMVVVGFALYALLQLRLGILRRENEKLEKNVAKRTREVREEQARSERLLLNILPRETAEELKQKGQTNSRHYDNVSVLFTDFKGFTHVTETLDSEVLVNTLDRYFRCFDALTSRFKVEKIKTIGDAYMCAAGIPSPCEDHAQRLVGFACALRDEVLEINKDQREHGLPAWDIRIGIHSGAVVAGVVGEKKFAYDIWGDTVNIAARMESSGEPNQINISGHTYALVKDEFDCEARGAVEAKNKGRLEMYFVRASKNGKA